MDKIICAGKNYLDHALEMHEGVPERPVLFLKPPSVLKICSNWGSTLNLRLPNNEESIHYECEFVFLISQNILTHVSVGLDMTNRTQQKIAKENGMPWTFGKVFRDAACIGPWIPLESIEINSLNFEFYVNDLLKQKTTASAMRMSPQELLEYASAHMPICEGDLLFTGTPSGIGAVHAGDRTRLIINQFEYNVYFEKA